MTFTELYNVYNLKFRREGKPLSPSDTTPIVAGHTRSGECKAYVIDIRGKSRRRPIGGLCGGVGSVAH